MEHLNTHNLSKCEFLLQLYSDNYDLHSGVQYEKEFYPIPYRERELLKQLELQHPLALKIDDKSYVSGFEKGYNKPLPATDIDILTLLVNGYSGLTYFATSGDITKSKDFGRSVGQIYNAWEVVLSRIEDFIPIIDGSKVNTNDTTNPLIFDIKLIYDLHREFNGYLFAAVDIDTFKNHFRKTPKRIIKNDGIGYSAICYFMGSIEHRQFGVSLFSEWMRFHIGGNNYGKLKKEFIEMAENARNDRHNFSLTIPQEKALDTMAYIDNRLKLMSID